MPSLRKEIELEIDNLWSAVGNNNLSISHDVYHIALELRGLIYGYYTLHSGSDGRTVRRKAVSGRVRRTEGGGRYPDQRVQTPIGTDPLS